MNGQDNKPAAPVENEIKSAILAGTAIAGPQKNPNPHGGAYAIVPPGYELQMLDMPALPTRRSGTVKLDDGASFIEYWNRQAIAGISYIYGSMQPAQFIAVLNEHSQGTALDGDEPNWRDHRAVFMLKHSKEWETWTDSNRKAFAGNEEFALWLEDNLPDITVPEPAKFMDIALNFRVRQGQFYGKAIRLQDGNAKIDYTNQVEARGSAVETVSIPETFTIRIPVFQGLEAELYDVEARFRFKLTNSALSIRYELVRPHKVVEQAFKDCLTEIEGAAKTKVLFGTPDA